METSGGRSSIFPEIDIYGVTRQEHALLDFQHRHDAKLDDLGMVDMALESDDLTDEQREVINDVTLATIHVTHGQDDYHNFRHSGYIRFMTPSEGMTRPHIAFVEVFHFYPQLKLVRMMNNYGLSQANAFMAMATELNKARRSRLSGLGMSLSSIIR